MRQARTQHTQTNLAVHKSAAGRRKETYNEVDPKQLPRKRAISWLAESANVALVQTWPSAQRIGSTGFASRTCAALRQGKLSHDGRVAFSAPALVSVGGIARVETNASTVHGHFLLGAQTLNKGSTASPGGVRQRKTENERNVQAMQFIPKLRGGIPRHTAADQRRACCAHGPDNGLHQSAPMADPISSPFQLLSLACDASSSTLTDNDSLEPH